MCKTRIAFQFIILLGIVSLLGDVIYEGARGVTGPYLAILGASAFVVGLVGGLGEFIGYVLRLFSGFVADRTKAYWLLTFIGYGLLSAIPLLAFASFWWVAVLFIIIERIGKAIRTPARDAILSYSTKKVGRGFGFGIHEALDQVGAVIGPLIFSILFLLGSSYQIGFSVLWIPLVILLCTLTVARTKVPFPEKFETTTEAIKNRNRPKNKKDKFPKIFLFYSLFIFLSVVGFANFLLISYHLKSQSIAGDAWIPVFFAIAMGVDGVVALAIGKTYDKIGLKTLLFAPALTIPIPFLVFSKNQFVAVSGIVLWGTVLGIHQTILRAAVADLTPISRRGLAYGIFNTIYGFAWLFGGFTMGFLYEISINYLIIFVVVFELCSVVVFFSVFSFKKELPITHSSTTKSPNRR